MKDEDEESKKSTEKINITPQPSIYRSTQSNLNGGSQQTLYQSVRNTLYDDAISLEFMNNGGDSPGDGIHVDDSSTLRGTAETVVEGSCRDLRWCEQSGDSRLVRHRWVFYFCLMVFQCLK